MAIDDAQKKVEVFLGGNADELVAALFGASKATKETVAGISSDLKTLEGGIESVGLAFGALGGIMAGGSIFKGVIDSSKVWIGEVVKLSKAMGMTTEQASIYNVALKTQGIDMDVALGATSKLTKTIRTNEAAFRAHHIAVRDNSRQLLAMPKIISNTFDALSKLRGGTSRNTAAQELLGRSFLELSVLAKINDKAMADATRTTQELGLMVGGDAVEAQKKYNIEINKMAISWTAFKINTAAAVKPAFLEISKLCNDFLKDSAIKDAIAFMANPIDFARNQASYFTQHSSQHPMIRLPMPSRPSDQSGEDYDPAKAAAEAAAAAQAEADALAAAKATDAMFKSYLSSREGLNRQLTGMNPNFSELQRKLLDVDDTVSKLTREMPQYSSTWHDFGVKMKGNISITERLKTATAGYKEEAKETEEVLKGMGSLKVFGQGLGGILGQGKEKQQSQFSLDGSRAPKKNFGADLLGGQSSEISPKMSAKENEEKLKIEADFNAQKDQLDGVSYARQLMRIDEQEKAWLKSYATLGGSFEENEKRKTEVAGIAAGQRAAIADKEFQGQIQNAQQGLQAASGLLTSLSALSKGKNKEMQVAQKGVQMGMAVANTALGVTKALALIPPPYDFVVAGLIAAAGAAQIATIAGSDSGGGSASVSGSSSAGGGGSSSSFVKQPTGGTARQSGNVTVQVMGNVIGEDAWVQNNLIPSINDAVGRGVTLNVPK